MIEEQNPNNELTQKTTTKRFGSVKIEKETADLLKIYCLCYKKTPTEFTTSLLERELQSFKKQLERMREESVVRRTKKNHYNK